MTYELSFEFPVFGEGIVPARDFSEILKKYILNNRFMYFLFLLPFCQIRIGALGEVAPFSVFDTCSQCVSNLLRRPKEFPEEINHFL